MLKLSPLSPGSAQLQFTRAPGYYYRLEKSTDLLSVTGFAPVSGWMFGDDASFTWPIQYSTGSPASGGSNGGSGSNALSLAAFDLYPFDNGKTLAAWSDSAGTRYKALVSENYASLPPIVIVPGDSNTSALFLLVGNIAWNPAYDFLSPSLLPSAQETYLLSSMRDRRAEILAAATANPSGPTAAR